MSAAIAHRATSCEAMTRTDLLLLPVLCNPTTEDTPPTQELVDLCKTCRQRSRVCSDELEARSSLAEAVKDLGFVALPGKEPGSGHVCAVLDGVALKPYSDKDPRGDWATLCEIQLAQAHWAVRCCEADVAIAV